MRGLALTALLLCNATGAAAQQKVESGPGAMLRGLDKVSGQTVDVEMQSGETQPVFGLDVALGIAAIRRTTRRAMPLPI